jgi:hypothetical protein
MALLSAVCLFAGTQQKPAPAGPSVGSPCSDPEKVAASVPRNVLDKLNDELSRSDFEDAVKTARAPGSGLRVASMSRDTKGRITSLCIINRNRCVVFLKKGPIRPNQF